MSTSLALGSRARISAHTIRDHLSNPLCSAADDVPWCAEAIAPAWLSRILCRDSFGSEVNRVEVADASSGSSVRKRIAVTYNAAGQQAALPTKFFAKTTPTVLTRLTSGPSAAQEAKFFASVRPLIPIETPVHHYSANDRVSGRSIHLFDDLVATQNATFCDYRTEFSEYQIAAALELLASLHGRFYNDPILESELSWVPPYEVFFKALAATGTRDGHDQALIEARHAIPERIFAAREKLWPAALAGLAAHASQARMVLHSDVHPGNWYLTGAGAPGLCDWQCIVQGHWARDFAYAVSTMLGVAQRRALESKLLRHYLQCLHQAGGPEISFDEAFEDYGKQLPGALLMWTPTLCHPPTMPDMQPEDVSIEMIRRITVAIDDLGVLEPV